jgi:hypothetical protein
MSITYHNFNQFTNQVRVSPFKDSHLNTINGYFCHRFAVPWYKEAGETLDLNTGVIAGCCSSIVEKTSYTD